MPSIADSHMLHAECNTRFELSVASPSRRFMHRHSIVMGTCKAASSTDDPAPTVQVSMAQRTGEAA